MNNESFQNFNTKEFKTFSDWLFKLNAYEFSLLSPLIASIISKPLTINQQNSLGNFFELLGQTMLTIAAQNTIIQANKKDIN